MSLPLQEKTRKQTLVVKEEFLMRGHIAAGILRWENLTYI